jgi:2,3,4,5-tetrahydropyridine-2-carboxylate N-succinyltransferase
MPPSYVNIGAWVGAGSMVDSHVLVGSCAQIGERVHLSAGVQVGGVLEPAGARPVIVEDDAFVGGGCGLYEGVLVGKRAVLGAGVQLTGTSRLYDLVEERVLCGTPDQPLVVPEGAVVVPGVRALAGDFARDHGLGLATAVIVKRRDARTDARTALESALR